MNINVTITTATLIARTFFCALLLDLKLFNLELFSLELFNFELPSFEVGRGRWTLETESKGGCWATTSKTK